MKFVRGEEVKYISHLDLMKTFERAIRRSGIPIAYSQGFNPHPHMVFGLPLSVGVTSQAEYGDFELAVPMSPQEFKESLNKSLPVGLSILCAKEKHVKDNIMASISAARYMLLLSSEQKQNAGELKDKIDEFISKPGIIIKKEGKKGTRDVDIKPMIYDLYVDGLNADSANDGEYIKAVAWLKEYVKSLGEGYRKPGFSIENIFCLSMLVSAGSAANLKPELLVSAFEAFLGYGLKVVKIHRTALLVSSKEKNADPLEDSIL